MSTIEKSAIRLRRENHELKETIKSMESKLRMFRLVLDSPDYQVSKERVIRQIDYILKEESFMQ